MNLDPKMFFPTDENGIIIEPPFFRINECHENYKKRVQLYDDLPTIYKARNHFKTSEYISCIVNSCYQILFKKNGKIILSCNFKEDKIVSTIQDLFDYGVKLTSK